LLLSGGREVVWGDVEDATGKQAALTALLRTPARVYDVSTPSVAVTRG
jgi:hypothetical protein